MIIVFSGTDGAGKSTQINMLRQALIERGTNSVYLWSRGGYTPLFSIIKKTARFILRKQLPKPGNSSKRDKILKNGKVSKIWLFIATIDLMILYGIYVRLLHLCGKIVICDRYIDDTQMDFEKNFNHSFSANSFIWRLLKTITPKPKISFLLHVPVHISQHRSALKNEPFPDTEETLTYRLTKYLDSHLFPNEKYMKIECTRPINEISAEITEKIYALL